MAVPETDEPRAGATEKLSKKVQIINYEIQCARHLAGNNKTTRDRALKSLQKWFKTQSYNLTLQESDLMRLWKGLFYSMWMSDKPLVQEECAENIANLIHSLPPEQGLNYFKCSLLTLLQEWDGIDQLRLDKFAMLVRRLLRQAIRVLRINQFDQNFIRIFTEYLSDSILNPKLRKPMGLVMHFTDIYLEEIAKIGSNDVTPDSLTNLLIPFIKQLASTDDLRLIKHIRQQVFVYLIRQSDLGLDYKEKYEAWKRLGFPGSIDSMKKIEVDDDDDNDDEEEEVVEKDEKEQVLDPRAGKIDVELPQLQFNAKAIAKTLLKYRFEPNSNTKARKVLMEIVDLFRKMSSGIYPLGIKRVKLATSKYDTNVRKAVNRLVKFEKQLKGERRKGKRKNDNIATSNKTKPKRIKIEGAENIVEKIEKPINKTTKKKRKNEGDSIKLRKRSSAQIPKTIPNKKRKLSLDTIDNIEIEAAFRRNSGVWIVTTQKQEEFKRILPNIEELPKMATPNFFQIEGLRRSPKNHTTTDNNNGGLLISKKSVNKQKLALDDSSLKKPKMSVLSPKRNDKNLMQGIEKSPIATPKQKVLPTVSSATGSGAKRVIINTQLNTSQEVSEHISQILSSPAIPYDASKKPSKPLLKTPIIASPINPFYYKRSPRLSAAIFSESF